MADTEKQIQIRVPEEALKGRYANVVYINSTREEFLIDFGLINPSQGNGIITDRIIMNPSHVKRMLEVLQRIMDAYEKQHGTVSAAETPREIGFHTA